MEKVYKVCVLDRAVPEPAADQMSDTLNSLVSCVIGMTMPMDTCDRLTKEGKLNFRSRLLSESANKWLVKIHKKVMADRGLTGKDVLTIDQMMAVLLEVFRELEKMIERCRERKESYVIKGEEAFARFKAENGLKE